MINVKLNTNGNSFEKLIVWEKTHQFVLEIYSITKEFPSDEKYLLVNQIRRSSSSIAANIVEGNERKSKKEFIQFLYTAKASLSETKYHLLLSKDLNYLDKNIYVKLNVQANEIGKLINGLINYLKK
ncbi:MAG: S23 ribosomal protein [Candidatus Roizmanbacteria bacterium GW2011_GWC2_37_13]|uniref:S23 ribosomal protein n=1 Tax=Candidatus Roizmanbacteria bacterium GW2011_GWC2_37_13 TaxID=1618486 RepID=A0A0G0GFP8_9BACT|nr:MAG: S23 ribosomal protein [Candidatus Roizmanbacteria bacterium GW2011_GWC1_37_12]KKQ24870.1 MAG: S23 ribosomal protein [Candidatus Roizmanbacteria bacterium GW2011_GWC2_37_13]